MTAIRTLALGTFIVIGFVVIVLLAQGIGQSFGGGLSEWLVR